MADIVHCNKEQAEKILETYFAHKPVITRVAKDDEDGIYFITAKTVPGMLLINRISERIRGSSKTFFHYEGKAITKVEAIEMLTNKSL